MWFQSSLQLRRCRSPRSASAVSTKCASRRCPCYTAAVKCTVHCHGGQPNPHCARLQDVVDAPPGVGCICKHTVNPLSTGEWAAPRIRLSRAAFDRYLNLAYFLGRVQRARRELGVWTRKVKSEVAAKKGPSPVAAVATTRMVRGWAFRLLMTTWELYMHNKLGIGHGLLPWNRHRVRYMLVHRSKEVTKQGFVGCDCSSSGGCAALCPCAVANVLCTKYCHTTTARTCRQDGCHCTGGCTAAMCPCMRSRQPCSSLCRPCTAGCPPPAAHENIFVYYNFVYYNFVYYICLL